MRKLSEELPPGVLEGKGQVTVMAKKRSKLITSSLNCVAQIFVD